MIKDGSWPKFSVPLFCKNDSSYTPNGLLFGECNLPDSQQFFQSANGNQWVAKISKNTFIFSGSACEWSTKGVDNPDYYAMRDELSDKLIRNIIGPRTPIVFLGIQLEAEEHFWFLSVTIAAAAVFGNL